jgi:hypothetical protein
MVAAWQHTPNIIINSIRYLAISYIMNHIPRSMYSKKNQGNSTCALFPI